MERSVSGMEFANVHGWSCFGRPGGIFITSLDIFYSLRKIYYASGCFITGADKCMWMPLDAF